MDEVTAYAKENDCADVNCEDVYVKDANDPNNRDMYQLVEITAEEENTAPAPAPAPTGWWGGWFGSTVSSYPNTIRKGAKRVNNYAADRNDKNLEYFYGLSNGYKSFQKDVQAKADQSAASAVLSPVIVGLNGVGTAIDTTNHLLVGGAHTGLNFLTGLTRTGLEYVKPALKPTKSGLGRHQPVAQ